MEITITQQQGSLIVLRIQGKLDGASYQGLIGEAQKLYNAGTHDLILDLGELTYISSAGISALHRVALLFRGEKQAVQEEGWAAYRAINRDRDGGVQKHVKLLNPTERVHQALEVVGFTAFFEIYTDLDLAIASFQ